MVYHYCPTCGHAVSRDNCFMSEDERCIICSECDNPVEYMDNTLLALIAAPRLLVFKQINDERIAQDEKWGNPEHDDKHDLLDWHALLGIRSWYLFDAICHPQRAKNTARNELLRVAALAIAAIESLDRKESTTK